MKFLILLSVSIIYTLLPEISGHGSLIDPPNRSIAWKYGFNTPPNYCDSCLHCGDYDILWRNGGKCGICGDAYDAKRENECPDGRYCTKTIVRTYKSGSQIKVVTNLGANHYGYYIFRICPVTDDSKEVTQECLDKHELLVAGTNSPIWKLQSNASGVDFTTTLQLPAGLKCSRCVLQWDWWCGNRYGSCGNGTSAMGCGRQELFRQCADVKIE